MWGYYEKNLGFLLTCLHICCSNIHHNLFLRKICKIGFLVQNSQNFYKISNNKIFANLPPVQEPLFLFLGHIPCLPNIRSSQESSHEFRTAGFVPVNSIEFHNFLVVSNFVRQKKFGEKKMRENSFREIFC